MTKLFSALTAIAVLGLSTAAFAGEPVQLTNQQMDTVTAGALPTLFGSVTLNAFAVGGNAAGTETNGSVVSFILPFHHTTVGFVFATGSSVSQSE